MHSAPEAFPAAPAAAPYAGEVVFLFAYDVAYELKREPIRELLGQPVAQFRVDLSRRSPRQPFMYQAQMVRLPVQQRVGPQGPVRVERSVKLLPIGAISISVRVPFSVARIADLVAYHDLQFSDGALNDEINRLAEEIRRELRPYVLRPIEHMPGEEAYTVFCLQSPLLTDAGAAQRAEVWLESHRREVAGLLTQETDFTKLSRQEVVESTSRSLSYYEDDLVVIDWDAALVSDQPAEWDETLYVLELANLQLAELEAYDRLLDVTLERSYRDLVIGALRRRASLIRELRELRIDMARFSDELSNITKFFGDWHLARIYESVASRFHLSDWHRTVGEKLKTLAELHELLKSDQGHRWMMILEGTIVLLFIIDLALLFLGLNK